MSTLELTWPPPYTLKAHPRARSVKLKASIKDGLQIIVPKRFNQRHLAEILETNKAWIVRQWDTLTQHQSRLKTPTLPLLLDLPALQQQWQITYIHEPTRPLKLIFNQPHHLTLLGNTEDHDLCKRRLLAYVKREARRFLSARLHYLSVYTNMAYSELSIRGQRARWGSCSEAKAISLNWKLLFLPLHLIDHIILHELCHTQVMNHTARFWAEVAKWDSEWKTHRRTMKQADHWIPTWID